MKRLLCFLFLFGVLFSCKDEPWSESDNLSNETENNYEREGSFDGMTYKLASRTQFFSEYQLAQLEEVRDSVLLFDSNSELGRLPGIGDVYICLERTQQFPNGFLGQVTSVEKYSSQIEIVTKSVPLPTAFNELTYQRSFGIDDIEGAYDENGNPIAFTTEDVIVDSLTEDSTADTRALSGSYQIRCKKFELKKVFQNEMFSVTIDGGLYFGGDMSLALDMNQSMFELDFNPFIRGFGNITGQISSELDFKDTKLFLFSLPLTATATSALFTPSVLVYAYVTASGTIEVAAEFGFTSQSDFKLRSEHGNWKVSRSPSKYSEKDPFDLKGVEGSLNLGIGFREIIGLTLFNKPVFWHGEDAEDAWVHLDQVFSMKCSGSISGESLEGLYTLLEPISGTFNADITLHINLVTFDLFAVNDVGFSMDVILLKAQLGNEFYLVPNFSKMLYRVGGTASVANLSYMVKRHVLFPTQVGIRVYEEESNVMVGEYWYERDYENSGKGQLVSAYFDNLETGTVYTAYPLVKSLFGIVMEGEPCKHFVLGEPDPDDADYGEEGDSGDEEEEEILQPFDDSLPVAEAINMGVSVKWASWNIGATSPEDPGGYYGFGDITGTRTTLNENAYPPSDPYMDVCGNSQYDIARAKWGGTWRLPTLAEFKELMDNSTVVDIYDASLDGILQTVMKIVSNITGNELILPYSYVRSGYWDNPNYGITRNSDGNYWVGDGIDHIMPSFSYILGSPTESLYRLAFVLNSPLYGYPSPKSLGLTVRPVCN